MANAIASPGPHGRMTAVVYERYGPPEVLQIRQVPIPTPAADEVLIKVRASTVSSGDWRMRRADPITARFYNGLLRPAKVTILGFELAGDVVAIGADVTRFKPGDAVFGSPGFAFGAHAEYLCMPAAGMLAAKPANLTYQEAAAIPNGAYTALLYLRKGGIQPGQRVLVNGASGAVGVYAVQLAHAFGAQVTGVCSTRNLDLVSRLGAERVIDYTREDFCAGSETYDIILDTVGKASYARCRSALAPDGVFLETAFSVMILLQMAWTARVGPQRVIHVTEQEGSGRTELLTIKGMVEAGQLRPVVDRCYSLAETAAAHAYVEQGHKIGSVIVEVSEAAAS